MQRNGCCRAELSFVQNLKNHLELQIFFDLSCVHYAKVCANMTLAIFERNILLLFLMSDSSLVAIALVV